MSRSPLSYPLNRHADMDAGGAADLQTDVMRFMAIISLCLVAIFALVQSLPTPTLPLPDLTLERATAAAPASASTVNAAIEPLAERTAGQQTLESPASRPIPEPVVAQEPVEQQRSAVDNSETKPIRRPDPVAATLVPRASPKVPISPPLASAAPPLPRKAAAEQDGFSLRFESDRALKRLVASEDIGFYALDQGKALRMIVNGAALSFWPASSPRQIYEMDESTVPADVVRALRRSAATEHVQWGVTLPRSMTRDLDRFLAERSGGALVIQSSGRLVLEN